MAFNIVTDMKGYEFRVLREDDWERDGNKGHYMHIIVEDDDCNQSKVSVPPDSQDMVRSLHIKKAQLVDLKVEVKAGSSYSSLKLVSILNIYNPDTGEVVDF